MCAKLQFLGCRWMSATGRLDPFVAPFGYDRYVRIAATSASAPDGSNPPTPVDVACCLNVRFGVAPNSGWTSLSGARRTAGVDVEWT
jgi:hypothetical protein